MTDSVYTHFIEGLRTYFKSIYLKWLIILFSVGTPILVVIGQLNPLFGGLLGSISLALGLFPTYFLLTFIASAVGFQTLAASDDSYKDCLIRFFPFIFASGVIVQLLIRFAFSTFSLLFICISFIGWFGFQSYFTGRNALSYIASEDIWGGSDVILGRPKANRIFLGMVSIFNIAILFGFFALTTLWFTPSILISPYGLPLGLSILGLGIGLVFNFFNLVIFAWKQYNRNVKYLILFSIFVSLYAGYLIQDLLIGHRAYIDSIHLIMTLAFVLYSMSSIGRIDYSTIGPAKINRIGNTRTRTAAFVLFLASSYIYVVSNIAQFIMGIQAVLLDGMKLIAFLLLALIVQMRYVLTRM